MLENFVDYGKVRHDDNLPGWGTTTRTEKTMEPKSMLDGLYARIWTCDYGFGQLQQRFGNQCRCCSCVDLMLWTTLRTPYSHYYIYTYVAVNEFYDEHGWKVKLKMNLQWIDFGAQSW